MDDGDDLEDEIEEEVGYRRPPKHSRWQKGISGNPNGRPRRSRNRAAIIRRLAYEERAFKEGERIGRDTTLSLILRAVRNSAANANPAGLSLYEFLLGQWPDQHDPTIPKGVFIVGEKLTVEEWEAKYGGG